MKKWVAFLTAAVYVFMSSSSFHGEERSSNQVRPSNQVKSSDQVNTQSNQNHIFPDEFGNVVLFLSFDEAAESDTAFTPQEYKTAYDLFSSQDKMSLTRYMDLYTEQTTKIYNYFNFSTKPPSSSYQLDKREAPSSKTESPSALLQAALAKALESDDGALADQMLDGDNDGFVDCVTFFVSGKAEERDSWNWPKQTSIGKNDALKIKAKNGRGETKELLFQDCVILPQAYDGKEMLKGDASVDTVVHEFLHLFGFPDLYGRNGDTKEVGPYDIMSGEGDSVVGSLEYTRRVYGGLGKDPLPVEEGGTYTLYPQKEAGKTEDSYARIGTEMGQDIYIECRKFDSSPQNLDQNKTEELGLLLYRVDTRVSAEEGNGGKKPHIFVYDAGEGSGIASRMLQPNSAQSSFGSTDLNATGKNLIFLEKENGTQNTGIQIQASDLTDDGGIRFSVHRSQERSLPLADAQVTAAPIQFGQMIQIQNPMEDCVYRVYQDEEKRKRLLVVLGQGGASLEAPVISKADQEQLAFFNAGGSLYVTVQEKGKGESQPTAVPFAAQPNPPLEDVTLTLGKSIFVGDPLSSANLPKSAKVKRSFDPKTGFAETGESETALGPWVFQNIEDTTDTPGEKRLVAPILLNNGGASEKKATAILQVKPRKITGVPLENPTMTIRATDSRNQSVESLASMLPQELTFPVQGNKERKVSGITWTTEQSFLPQGGAYVFQAVIPKTDAEIDWSAPVEVIGKVQTLAAKDGFYFLSGVASDAKKGEPLSGVLVSLFYKNEVTGQLEKTEEQYTGADGSFLFLAKKGEYSLQYEKYWYQKGQTELFPFPGSSVSIAMEPVKRMPPKIEFPVAQPVVFGNTLAASYLKGGSEFGFFLWQEESQVPKPGNAGYDVVFVPDATDAYDYTGVTLTGKVPVAVLRAKSNLMLMAPEVVCLGEKVEVTAVIGGADGFVDFYQNFVGGKYLGRSPLKEGKAVLQLPLDITKEEERKSICASYSGSASYEPAQGRVSFRVVADKSTKGVSFFSLSYKNPKTWDAQMLDLTVHGTNLQDAGRITVHAKGENGTIVQAKAELQQDGKTAIARVPLPQNKSVYPQKYTLQVRSNGRLQEITTGPGEIQVPGYQSIAVEQGTKLQ